MPPTAEAYVHVITYSDSEWVLLHMAPTAAKCFKFFTYSSSGTKTEESDFSEREKLNCCTAEGVCSKYNSMNFLWQTAASRWKVSRLFRSLLLLHLQGVLVVW